MVEHLYNNIRHYRNPPLAVCNAVYEIGKLKSEQGVFVEAPQQLHSLQSCCLPCLQPKKTWAAPQSPKLPQNSLYCDGMGSNINTLQCSWAIDFFSTKAFSCIRRQLLLETAMCPDGSLALATSAVRLVLCCILAQFEQIQTLLQWQHSRSR